MTDRKDKIYCKIGNINIDKVKNNYRKVIGNGTVVLKFKASSEIGLGHLSRMITLTTFLEEDKTDVICAINGFEYAEERLKKENGIFGTRRK